MPSPVDAYLASVHAAHLPDLRGDVYERPPDVVRADPDAFGICLATIDGHLYEAGDTRTDFGIESISKTFTYALALADRGLEAVDEKIDVEPSGEAFYEISLGRDRPGVDHRVARASRLAAASLVAGATLDERYERVRS